MRIYRALTLRDADFLTACIEVLSSTEMNHIAPSSDFYEKLASHEWSKLQVIEGLLSHFGYIALVQEQEPVTRYDFAHLLNFAEGDEQRFVSMAIDFAAARPPTPDEALQFEQLLVSGRKSRRQVFQMIAERYADTISIYGDDVLVIPRLDSSLTICQTWRERLYFHPNVTLAAKHNEFEGWIEAKEGPILSCELTLLGAGHWQAYYDLKNSNECTLQIDIQDQKTKTMLCRSCAIGDLNGVAGFSLPTESTTVLISIRCLNRTLSCRTLLTPVNIRLQQAN